ncbi:orotate phosphoribosyltransferase [Clostridia bacterium]|nr:orotate phosphoribosyltransferase [Clostridia bacterium]
MLTNEQIIEIFEESEALLNGHFRLTSGRHSGQYVQCAQVLKFPEYTEALCEHMAESFVDDEVDLVVGPAMGGVTLSYEMARQLGTPSLFTERVDNKMTLRRNFFIPKGARVLVTEDVTTTGGSVIEVINLVREAGGVVVGTAVLVDRSGGTLDLGVDKQVSALTLDVVSFDAEECPLCKDGVPIVKPGSRKVD